MIDQLTVDARQALRAFRRQKGLVLGAVAALALGIGATTTMFSIVHGATRGLPFHQSDELTAITARRQQQGNADLLLTQETYRAIAEQQSSFEGMAAFVDASVNLSGPEARPERRSAATITPNTFALLGVAPILGRGITDTDIQPGGPNVVLLSHELWQARYAADAAIVGKTVRIESEPHVVIGVMPDGFGFPISAKLWLPLRNDAADSDRHVRVLGRLNDGVSIDQARSELAVIGRRLEQTEPARYRGSSLHVIRFVELEMEASVRRFLFLMLGAVSFVLVIACANVANLLLARAATRTRDIAICTALGADRSRLIGQHLLESFLIAACGGLLGTLAAHIGVSFFARSTSNIIEAFWMEFRVNGVVLAFAALATTAAAVAAGLIPALQASRAQPAGFLKDESHGSSSLRVSRFSRGLVVVQVALACGLLALASVFIQSALALRNAPMPFDTHSVLTAQIGNSPRLDDDVSRAVFLRELVERVNTINGVRASAFMTALPGRGSGSISFARENETGQTFDQLPRSALVAVTPGFLEVLESRVARGRDLRWSDNAQSPGAMLVNEDWVARFSADRNPIGRQLVVRDQSFTIVGVVPDLHVQDVGDRNAEAMYVPLLQSPGFLFRLIARVQGAPLAVLPQVRDAIEASDPDLPVFEALSLHDAMYSDAKILDAFAWLFFAFGIGALILTITGLYGVISFGVSSRTRELGIRRALGARTIDILRLVLHQGVGQLALGFLIGSTIAFALGRGAASAMEQIDGVDPRAFALVLVALSVTGLAALVSPARRAAGVEPVDALKR
jgi:putative ABC transport system permease protein